MVAHTAIVLAEGDIEDPMQSVLDRPMRADRFAENGRIIATARQEIADLGLHLGRAVDAADGLDGQGKRFVATFAKISRNRPFRYGTTGGHFSWFSLSKAGISINAHSCVCPDSTASTVCKPGQSFRASS